MSSVLKVDNIEKYYGSKANLTKAIDRISFEVEEGEYIGIMGASGSGKTTLLNCISTIDHVTAGNIMINGMDITKLKGKHLSRFRREELGFIFQDFNLLDTLTVFENIALALTIMKIPAREIEDRVRSIAEKLMITEVLNKYPYQMSGGQKQRVASARAMITNPSLILADEPTGALDSKAARMLLDSMETMNVELNATILMVTHDAFTASYCKRILFIKDGKIFYETPLTFAKLSEYNKIRKAIGEKELTLKSDEYILNCDYGNLIPIMEKAASDKQKLTLDGKTYKMKYGLQKDTYMVTAAKTDMGTVILNDEIIQSLKIDHSTLYLNLNWKGNAQKVSRKYTEYLKQMIINSKMPNSPYSAIISKEEVYEQSTGLSTIITYIAIYIGLVFLITCAAVLALQQLSENADNIEKYKLLSKIGTSQKMINHAIKAQIILYFCLPLSLALVHSYVGIKTAKILISTLGQINITQAAVQSLILVIVIYIGYMIATYLGSKSMLKEK